MVKRIAVLWLALILCMGTALAQAPDPADTARRMREKIMDWFHDKSQEAEIHKAAFKIMNGGDASDPDTIVEDYFLIIKDLHSEKPQRVELCEEDFASVIVDGEEYDLFMIPHDDGDNINRRMEIEVLLNDETPTALIQEKLNQMIEEKW